jgi:hypothetical protein
VAGESNDSTPFTFAYITRNPYVFHSVSMNWRTLSPTLSTEKR